MTGSALIPSDQDSQRGFTGAWWRKQTDRQSPWNCEQDIRCGCHRPSQRTATWWSESTSRSAETLHQQHPANNTLYSVPTNNCLYSTHDTNFTYSL